MHHLSAAARFCVVIAIAGLVGCNVEKDLAATVNQAPISIAEVDALLAQRNLTPASATPEQRNKALEELITQKLLVEAAYAIDLHKDPEVVLASEEVLARAYVEKQLGRKTATPDEAELERFYDSNLELFAERKRYQLQEIAINAASQEINALNEYVSQINTLQELVAWLDNKNIKYQTGAAIKSADELPSDMLSYLKDMQDGELVKVQRPQGLLVIQLVRRFSDPVTFTDARIDILKYLRNRQFESSLESFDSELRANAKIERFPPYGGTENIP